MGLFYFEGMILLVFVFALFYGIVLLFSDLANANKLLLWVFLYFM